MTNFLSLKINLNINLMKKLFRSLLFVFLVISKFNGIVSAQTTPIVLTSFSTNNNYNAYFNFAVNNTHFIDNDEQGNIYVVFVDSIKQLTVMTRDNGNWYTQVVIAAGMSETYKNPTIQWNQGKLHVSWFVLTSGNSTIKYAKGNPVSAGNFNWTISTFASLPIFAPKYLAMTVPDSTFSPHIGFTEAGDSNARMFVQSGESSLSPLTSAYPNWIRSSDISIASDSNIVAVVWEEHWLVSPPDSRLFFTISYDGGNTWSSMQKVLNPDPSFQVGDPSIVIADSIVYVAFHGSVSSTLSQIHVARKFPSMTNFELLDFGTLDTGVVGNGWLPNIHAQSQNPDKVVVSWERTDSAYFNKWEHRVAVAYICNANQPNPTLILGPETTSPINDTSLYDLNSNIIISSDGQTASWVWINIQELTSNSDLIMTLYFQEDTLNCSTTGIDEIISKEEFAIYPNPTTNTIHFSSPQTDISIYNTQGTLVAEFKNETLHISVDNLPTGTYFVQTKTGNGKFIKTE